MSDWVLHCPSCPTGYALGAGLFGCPGSAAGGEHILRRALSAGHPTAEELRAAWIRGGGTFARLNPLLSARRLAGEAGYARILERVSGNLLRHEGRAFDVTPLAAAPALAAAIGRSGRLWVKDETGNVTGSHKGRHLMGTLLYLEALKSHRSDSRPERARDLQLRQRRARGRGGRARRRLRAARLRPGRRGPASWPGCSPRAAPSWRRSPAARPGRATPATSPFRRPSPKRAGSPSPAPATTTGPTSRAAPRWGGKLVLQMAERSETLEHVVIQVGGGALARAVAQALEEADRLGLIPRLPRIHVCQPAGGFPFVRAWLLALAEIARRSGRSFDLSYDRAADPLEQLQRALEFSRTRTEQIQEIAGYACRSFDSPVVQSVLTRMAGNAGHFMWPWDGPAPAQPGARHSGRRDLRLVPPAPGRAAHGRAGGDPGRRHDRPRLRPRAAAHRDPGLPDGGGGAGRPDPADRMRGRSTRANRPACSSRGLTGLRPGDMKNDFSATGPERTAPRR